MTSPRDQARALFATSGLHRTKVLAPASLRRLIKCIDAAMMEANLMGGWFRMRRALGLRDNRAALRCKAHYFDDREAVTFHEDGFIGFAGWADDKNIVPIVAGFRQWVEDSTNGR